MSDKVSDKIKRCSICGEAPELHIYPDYYRVMCMKCWQRTHFVPTEKEAIDLWNKYN